LRENSEDCVLLIENVKQFLPLSRESSEGASNACRKKLSGLKSSRLIPDIDGRREEFDDDGTAIAEFGIKQGMVSGTELKEGSDDCT
jgi:hypothetical protein